MTRKFSYWFSKYENVFDKAYVTDTCLFKTVSIKESYLLVSITKVRTQPETEEEQVGT